MTPIPRRGIDYLGLAESFTMTGFPCIKPSKQDPEIYRFEFSDLSQDIHVWLFPLKGEVVVIRGLMEVADSEEESFDHVPVPSKVRFSEYLTLFEILRRFIYSSNG
jgi:hypothetical protein